MTTKKSLSKRPFLECLGIYGYDAIEPVILASLVTGDPLLLIGKCGTGKTLLLNNLSAALGLNHRHYNASLISFDDLVGFPYPAEDFTKIRYLETPATIWEAESVLVDEISRCKPEHQNRLFSLIQERKIQGIEISKLRYRWAAMNPCTQDQASDDFYEGSEPLDQALADRFAFVVSVPDWADFTDKAHRAIACPADIEIAPGSGDMIKQNLKKWQADYGEFLRDPPDKVSDYCRIAATELGAAGLRFSPRRVRQLAKNIFALLAAGGLKNEERTYKLALRWSFPHRAWGVEPKDQILRGVHRTAWDAACAIGVEKWLSEFHLEKSLAGKIEKLSQNVPDPDTATLAVTQLLANEPKDRAALFAYAVYPAAVNGKYTIGSEGIAELARVAKAVLDIDGEVRYRDNLPEHPQRGRLMRVLKTLEGTRRERAAQFFNYLFVSEIVPVNPRLLEEELNQCIIQARS